MSLLIIVAAFVIYLIVLIIQKLSEKEKNFYDDNLGSNIRRRMFQLEDLPYHEIRLYF